MRLRDVKIDAEFEALLRKQSDLEAAEMAASIRKFGYLVDLIVCECPTDSTLNGTLVDGHSRYRHWEAQRRLWLTEHEAWKKSCPGVTAKVFGAKDLPEPKEPQEPGFVFRRFVDRGEVIKFIGELQAARRNLSQHELSVLLGRKFEAAKAELGSSQAAAEKVAKEHGVSTRTVVRAGEYAQSVATVEKFVTDIGDRMATPGGPTGEDVKALSKMLDLALKMNIPLLNADGTTMSPDEIVAWQEADKARKKAAKKAAKDKVNESKDKECDVPVKAHKRAKPNSTESKTEPARIDAAHEEVPAPTWMDHLASLTVALTAFKEMWEDSVDEERLVVKKKVGEFVNYIKATETSLTA